MSDEKVICVRCTFSLFLLRKKEKGGERFARTTSVVRLIIQLFAIHELILLFFFFFCIKFDVTIINNNKHEYFEKKSSFVFVIPSFFNSMLFVDYDNTN